MTRRLLRTVLLALSLVVGTVARAGDVEDGNAAFEKQDYATALKKFKSAAEKNIFLHNFKLAIFTTKV